MFKKMNYFLLHDGDTWRISNDTGKLRELCKQHGILFWCNRGEWRAIGGDRLTTLVDDLTTWEIQRQNFTEAYIPDHLIPDQAYAYVEWADAIPVPAELVRWLRQEAEELSQSDTTADPATEGNAD